MRLFLNSLKSILCIVGLGLFNFAYSDNQTLNTSSILPSTFLPFEINIELVSQDDGTPFLLPNGIQGYVTGAHKEKWLFLGGRTNGLHGFDNNTNNFPPMEQNRTLYVVDIEEKKVYSRSLLDIQSGLTQDQIDSLSVVASQYYQQKETLYMSGGYGFRNSVNQFATFDFLTAIDIPGLIHWVTNPGALEKASQHIRQIADPTFQVTGGAMHQLSKRSPTLLVFGNNFEGAYRPGGTAVQTYTKEVRKFKILDDGKHLDVEILSPSSQEEIFRRRDLNVPPVIQKISKKGKERYGLVALSGVFTVTGGIWTVPVNVNHRGEPSMPDPFNPFTFKQGMNGYTSAFAGLYSAKTEDMYLILLGGITYEYFQDGLFQEDSELPFTNEVTTVKLDKQGLYSQFLMDAEYPLIVSTGSNPGNPLLFGTSCDFIPSHKFHKHGYKYSILNLDKIKESAVIGYVVGGIASTLPNTNSRFDSMASPYIFKVTLAPR